MAIGNISDWQKIDAPNARERVSDWRRFEKPSTAQRVAAEEREQESRRCAAYDEYVQLVENDQLRVQPRYKVSPISYSEWSKHLPTDVTDISLASQIATNAALLSKVRSEEKTQSDAALEAAKRTVLLGNPDPAWKQLCNVASTLSSLNMTQAQVRDYRKQQSEKFIEENPDWPRTENNFLTMMAYLANNGVEVPNAQILKIAFERLKAFSLLEEVAAPEPALSPEPQQSDIPVDPELVDGYDLETGEPRQYTKAEVWRMSSKDVKQAFRMWNDGTTDRRARFTRGYFG